MPTLSLSTSISAPLERCFDLARSIDHHLESMRGSGERAVAGVTSGLIGPGQDVTWEGRHFGVRLRFTSRITAFRPPTYFQDSMIAGPFAAFVHDHYFEVEQGKTTIRDRIEFRSPLGPLGALVDRLVLGPYLQRLVTKRNQAIKRAAEHDSGGSAA